MAQARNTQPAAPQQAPVSAIPADVFTVSTAKREGAKPVETKLSFDWTGVSEDDMKKLARRALVINWQRMVRSGDGDIPPTDTIVVADAINGTGRRARVLTPDRVLEAVKDDPAKLQAMIAKLTAEAQKLQAPKK